MIDPSSFKIRFPEFSCADDVRVQMFIDESVIILNETYWDTKYDLGLYYLTAHFMEIAGESEGGSTGSTGPVQSQAVDGTNISFAITSTDKDDVIYYSSTIYGQRYLALRKTLGVPACVI